MGGGDNCSEGGRLGSDGAAGSSSESSGVSCGFRGGKVTLAAAASAGGDFFCIIPAIAAAGPVWACIGDGDKLSRSASWADASGDNGGWDGVVSALPVISM